MTNHSNKHPDRIAALRARYEEAIRNKRVEIETLQQKIALLEEIQSDASLVNPTKNRYSEIGLTEAAHLTLTEIGEGKHVTVSDVRKHLINNGFVPQGKNFSISVGTALKRLAKQHKIKTDFVDGRRVFWKEPTQYRIVTTTLPVASNEIFSAATGITGGNR
jgi:hypothetical protein